MNILKFPLIAMFWNMIFYMCQAELVLLCHEACESRAFIFSCPSGVAVRVYLAYFTDCKFFDAEPKMDMVQCAAKYEAPTSGLHFHHC